MAANTEDKKTGKLVAERLKTFEGASLETEFPAPPKPPRAKNTVFQKYGNLKLFQKPVQLITADKEKHLRFNEEAVAELMKISHKINAVAVVGPYRTGKSLLLNRMAGVSKAFGVGSSHNAVTKGIWIFCRPHPVEESQVLILLDTEGLADAMKDNLIEDQWHFILATLLSSTLVYNHKGNLDADAIMKLEFLRNIKTSINVDASKSTDDSFLDVFFPTFIVAVRDNTLETEDEDGNSITPDKFLEKVLVQKRGSTDSIQKYNEPRILVRRYFKERKCFMFSPPGKAKELDERKIPANSSFERDVEEFLKYIYGRKPKRMASGKVLTGRMFGSLVMSYTTCIQKRQPPCLHEAAKEMIEYENQCILEEAQNIYKKAMQGFVGSNMPDSKVMGDFHGKCTEKAIEYLRQNIVYDDIQLYLENAKDSFIEVFNRLKKAIEKDSENISWEKLKYLEATRVAEKLKMGKYEHVDGYKEYIADIAWIIEEYNNTAGLGPKMSDVLQLYLDSKENEEEQVYQMVLKVHEESEKGKNVKQLETFKRSSVELLTNPEERKLQSPSGIPDHLFQKIIEDQKLQRDEMKDNFFSFMKLKIAEYERQVAEGVDLADVTKEENDRFKTTFLESSTQKSSESLSSAVKGDNIRPLPKPRRCKIL